jgi:CIC family chloride channel protein
MTGSEAARPLALPMRPAVNYCSPYNMNPPTHAIEQAATRGGLPVSPSLGPTLEYANLQPHPPLVDSRVALISTLCVLLACVVAFIAWFLVVLISFITNLSFYGRFSTQTAAPTIDYWGAWVIVVPVIGALIVGFMARYGSAGIRGHGIPEAMEQVLTRQSRIPPRLTFLKPLSAAIAIGTGGPFGAEGPIIATGGALGSLLGQLLKTTAAERKTLLAAGAAAGMAATFGSPVAATLLAIELLLFEFRPRSFVPVALASTTAAGLRFLFKLPYPVFAMPEFHHLPEFSLLIYILIGAVAGLVSVYVTRAVYAVEDLFDLLPIHWMWWPAIGAVAVGVIGYFAPNTFGVGYDNISHAISMSLTVKAMILLCILKFTSWCIALGSGTSGGTLAPLFTIGSTLGALMGIGAAHLFPSAAIDPRIAALVGMAALFAGASRALLTSVVFAFETTLQPLGLLPLLGGCTAAYFISAALMPDTIMTAKIARRGIRVPSEYFADFLDQLTVADVLTSNPICLKATQLLGEFRTWVNSGAAGTAHQGYPVMSETGQLIGVLTRRDLLTDDRPSTTPIRDIVHRPPLTIFADSTLRQAADHMVSADVGRLAVVDRNDPVKLIGIVTRGDVLSAHRRRLSEGTNAERSLRVSRFGLRPNNKSKREVRAAPH